MTASVLDCIQICTHRFKTATHTICQRGSQFARIDVGSLTVVAYSNHRMRSMFELLLAPSHSDRWSPLFCRRFATIILRVVHVCMPLITETTVSLVRTPYLLIKSRSLDAIVASPTISIVSEICTYVSWHEYIWLRSSTRVRGAGMMSPCRTRQQGDMADILAAVSPPLVLERRSSSSPLTIPGTKVFRNEHPPLPRLSLASSITDSVPHAVPRQF